MSEVKTEIHVDPSEDRFTVNRVQDVEPILERAKALHNAGIGQSGEWRHAASIPNVIVERYCEDAGITFREFAMNEVHQRRLLESPDLSHFRIWKGRL